MLQQAVNEREAAVKRTTQTASALQEALVKLKEAEIAKLTAEAGYTIAAQARGVIRKQYEDALAKQRAATEYLAGLANNRKIDAQREAERRESEARRIATEQSAAAEAVDRKANPEKYAQLDQQRKEQEQRANPASYLPRAEAELKEARLRAQSAAASLMAAQEFEAKAKAARQAAAAKVQTLHKGKRSP